MWGAGRGGTAAVSSARVARTSAGRAPLQFPPQAGGRLSPRDMAAGNPTVPPAGGGKLALRPCPPTRLPAPLQAAGKRDAGILQGDMRQFSPAGGGKARSTARQPGISSSFTRRRGGRQRRPNRPARPVRRVRPVRPVRQVRRVRQARQVTRGGFCGRVGRGRDLQYRSRGLSERLREYVRMPACLLPECRRA